MASLFAVKLLECEDSTARLNFKYSGMPKYLMSGMYSIYFLLCFSAKIVCPKLRYT